MELDYDIWCDATASTLVLCDWQEELDLERWLELSDAFFLQTGSLINSAFYRQEGGRSRSISRKGLNKAIKKTDIRSIESQEIIAPYDNVANATTYAAFSISGRKKTAVFSHISNAIDGNLFSAISQGFMKAAGACYGFGYLRAMDLGPVYFAYGVGFDRKNIIGTDKVESQEMVLWNLERTDMIVQKKPGLFRHWEGLLRDVFPLNVLTAAQVRREVAGQKLADWIAGDANRGSLTKIAESTWIWVVPEISRLEIRDYLSAWGLLIVKPPEIRDPGLRLI